MEDLNDKITGDTLQAAEFVQPMSELQNVIEGLGITLSNTDLNQLGKGIAGYVSNGNFYTDSGAADVYVLTKIGLKQTAPEYKNGMEVAFIVGNTNTGASTANVAGLGVKNIKTKDGNDPQAGDLTVNELAECRYDGANLVLERTGNIVFIDTIQSRTTGVAPVFEDDAGREVGQLSKTWVNFNGTGTIAIRDSFNVSSLTDNAAGDYTVNFTNNMANANYCAVTTCSRTVEGGQVSVASLANITISSYRFITMNGDGSTPVDSDPVMVSIFGD